MGGEFGGGSMFRGGGIERPSHGIEQPGRSIEQPGRSIEQPGRSIEQPGSDDLHHRFKHFDRRERILRIGPEDSRVVTTPEPKPDPEWTRRIKLDYADPTKPGIVDVHKIKLDSKVSPVVITSARAAQIGRLERQINKYRYQMVRPTASLDRLLRWHPVRQRALAGLVANPKSLLANYVFRQLLPSKSLIACGRPRFTETSGPRITKIAARANEQGLFEVTGSQGVHIGVLGTQHNDFRFRVMKPELSLAHVLRDRPDLTQALATALGDPGNEAVRHSLEIRLAGAYTRIGGLISEIRGQFDGGGLSVTDAYAVQLGKYNSRVDKVALEVRKVVLTGWGSAGKLGLERPGKGPEPGLLRNELDHRQRAGLAGSDSDAGHMRLTAADTSNMVVGPALRTMATVAVSAFTPGRPHLVGGLAADLSTALETTTPFGQRSDLMLKAPVLLRDGMFSLGARPARSDHRSVDESLPVSLSAELSRLGSAEIGAGANHPLVFVVDAQAEQAEVYLGYQAADVVGTPDVTPAQRSGPLAGGSHGQQPALPGAEPQAPRAALGPADGSQAPVAVVIWGTALLAAAGRRVLDPDTLVCFARQAILRAIHDGSPASAALAMRLVCALEVVVLLGVVLNGGIWIDVNPGTGEAAATLLIDGFPGDPGGTMRFICS